MSFQVALKTVLRFCALNVLKKHRDWSLTVLLTNLFSNDAVKLSWLLLTLVC